LVDEAPNDVTTAPRCQLNGVNCVQADADKLVTEASLYCQTAARDVVVRRHLMRRYPHRIYPVIYDDMVRDVAGHATDVYRFLDEPLSAATLQWIANNARRRRNGTTISTRWKDRLTVRQNEQILTACDELFRLMRLTSDVE